MGMATGWGTGRPTLQLLRAGIPVALDPGICLTLGKSRVSMLVAVASGRRLAQHLWVPRDHRPPITHILTYTHRHMHTHVSHICMHTLNFQRKGKFWKVS